MLLRDHAQTFISRQEDCNISNRYLGNAAFLLFWSRYISMFSLNCESATATALVMIR